MNSSIPGRHKESSDSNLVGRILAGDNKAFALLVARHSDAIFRSTMRIVKDWHLSEDICQEAFLDSFRRLRQLRDPAKYYPWLRNIVRNRCLMVLRQEKALVSSLEEDVMADTRYPSPDETLSRAVASEITSELMKVLSSTEASAADLFYISGYNTREIADRLRISPTAVYSRLHKARRRMKSAILGHRTVKIHKKLVTSLIQLVEERYIMDDIRIELSRELLGLLDKTRHSPDLLEAIGELRERLQQSDVLQLPRVKVVDNLALPNSCVSIFIKGIESVRQRIVDISTTHELVSLIEEEVRKSRDVISISD
jgi:RNA polymerase sigma-70 factor, ECF subfamily